MFRCRQDDKSSWVVRTVKLTSLMGKLLLFVLLRVVQEDVSVFWNWCLF